MNNHPLQSECCVSGKAVAGFASDGKENHWSVKPSKVKTKPAVTIRGYSTVTSAIGFAFP